MKENTPNNCNTTLPVQGLSIEDFKIGQIFDSEGCHCDTKLSSQEVGDGVYTITIKNLGRSDKAVEEKPNHSKLKQK